MAEDGVDRPRSVGSLARTESGLQAGLGAPLPAMSKMHTKGPTPRLFPACGGATLTGEGVASLDFKQHLRLGVELQQKLVMTPQLQQAIKLLQLSRVELLESVQQELLENPALADDEAEPGSPTGEFPKVEATGEFPKAEATGEVPRVEDLGAAKDPEPDEPRGADEPETDWEQYVEYYSSQNYGGGGVRAADDELPTVEQTLSKQTSLADHLDWQLGLTLLAMLPIAILPVMFIGRIIRKMSNTAQSRLADAGSEAAEALDAIELVQAYNREDSRLAAFLHRTEGFFFQCLQHNGSRRQ